MIMLDHIALNAADAERTLRFYADLLEAGTERWAAYLAGEAPFPSLRLSDSLIMDIFPPGLWRDAGGGAAEDGGPAVKQGASCRNLHHFCLVLSPDQWARAEARARRANAIVSREPETVWGARGYGLSFYVRDPDGTIMELKKYEVRK